LPEYPSFATPPPPRCFAPTGNPERPICGELAPWRSPFPTSGEVSCRCDVHRLPTDEPIVGEQLQRRIRVSLVVDLAGTAYRPEDAKAEAVERLYRAVADIGGVMNLLDASSEIGLARLPPARGVVLAGAGQGVGAPPEALGRYGAS
jgi:hypothetical protein